MPYSFIGIGGARVQNDIRIQGMYSGTSTNIYTTGNTVYPGGRALGILTTGTGSSTTPGTATDYFCAQLSSVPIQTLYAQNRGWACYWRQMTWIPDSVTVNVTYDGTNYWLPTTSNVTGSWIGKSTDGQSWNFTQVTGAQNSAALLGPPLAFKGTFVYPDRTSSDALMKYLAGDGTIQTTTISGYGSNLFYAGYASDTRIAYVDFGSGTSGTGRIITATDPAGPWSSLQTTTQSWRSVLNIPGTSIWLFGGSGGSIARSTDDLATNPSRTQVANGSYYFNGLAASPTSVIGFALQSATPQNLIYRSTDQGQSWSTVPSQAAWGQLSGLAYGNGRYVGFSSNQAVIVVSVDDGLTWTSYPSPSPALLTSASGAVFDAMKFQNGKFWFCVSNTTGNDYFVATSVDGINWEVMLSAPAPVATASQNLGTSTNGIFIADPQNMSGTSYFPVGFTPGNNSYNASTFLSTVINNSRTVLAAPFSLGMNQWHEFQLVARPSTTPNNWNITFIIDGVIAQTSTTTGWENRSAASTIWFTIDRGAYSHYTADIVFYDFPAIDPIQALGPDLRVYYDQPATDADTQWSPSIDGQPNAEMVAVASPTNAPTYVYESGQFQIDQYTMQPTKAPTGSSVLSTTNEAYFSLLTTTPNVQVQTGVSSGGSIVDSNPQTMLSPVNSWTYVKQVVDTDPITGQAWTTNGLNSAQIRVIRGLDNSMSMALDFEGTNGSTSFADLRNPGRILTASNGAVISTDQANNGASSAFFPFRTLDTGVPGAGIITTITPDIQWTADFWFECWVYYTQVGDPTYSGNRNCIFGTGTYQGSSPGNWIELNEGKLTLQAVSGTSVTLVAQGSTTIPVNSWHHVAIGRSGATLKMYVDGFADYSGTYTQILNGGTDNICIGNYIDARVSTTAGGYAPFIGYIDRMRIYNGQCLHTSNFTPETGLYPN